MLSATASAGNNTATQCYDVCQLQQGHVELRCGRRAQQHRCAAVSYNPSDRAADKAGVNAGGGLSIKKKLL